MVSGCQGVVLSFLSLQFSFFLPPLPDEFPIVSASNNALGACMSLLRSLLVGVANTLIGLGVM